MTLFYTQVVSKFGAGYSFNGSGHQVDSHQPFTVGDRAFLQRSTSLDAEVLATVLAPVRHGFMTRFPSLHGTATRAVPLTLPATALKVGHRLFLGVETLHELIETESFSL